MHEEPFGYRLAHHGYLLRSCPVEVKKFTVAGQEVENVSPWRAGAFQFHLIYENYTFI